MGLIPSPDLDIRDEELMAAQAVGRVSGTRTIERIDSQIEELRHEREMALAGAPLPPVCPELTNANPSSPHTVILEAEAWLLAQLARRINQLPERDQIEFHRLFGIELDGPTVATTTLQFTVDWDSGGPSLPESVDPVVVIPAATQASTLDEKYVFETDEELVIHFPAIVGEVAATRTEPGAVLLGANQVTKLLTPIFFISGVTNGLSIDSGTDAETLDQALARARNYQRRAERLVSAKDLEDAILEEVLLGSGIVKAFPFVMAGDFDSLNHPRAGHTTVVVMTPTGNPVNDAVKAQIVETMEQAIGSQFIYIIDPVFHPFSVEADIKVEGITSQLAIVAAVEQNLRTFYATKKGNFGRPILRSEIIAIIEGTPGVDRIASDADGPIVNSPAVDIVLAPYELPKLNAVLLHVVP